VGHHRALLGEALDVLGLLLKEGLGDEQREVGVAVPRRLEHRVHVALDVLPQGVAPRFDDHAAADRRILGQVGGADDLLIPLGVVLGTSGSNRGGLFFRHVRGAGLKEVRAAHHIPEGGEGGEGGRGARHLLGRSERWGFSSR
jgi:hypothetical protein